MKRRTEYEKILDFCDTGGHRFYGGVCGAVLHGAGLAAQAEAPAMVYFAASLRHMALLKGLAAMVVALVAATVPYWDDLREPLPEEL